jgi:hypothetical protein
MSNINIPTYTGTIGNLNVNGTLTCGNFVTTGSSLKGLGLALYDNSRSQSIPANTVTVILFGTVTNNTMGADVTLSNTNSRITYNGTATRNWIVAYTAGSANCSGSAFQPFLFKNSDTSISYGKVYANTVSNSLNIVSTSTIVPMSTGDYLELGVFHNGSGAITVSTASIPSRLSIIE